MDSSANSENQQQLNGEPIEIDTSIMVNFSLAP